MLIPSQRIFFGLEYLGDAHLMRLPQRPVLKLTKCLDKRAPQSVLEHLFASPQKLLVIRIVLVILVWVSGKKARGKVNNLLRQQLLSSAVTSGCIYR